MTVQEIANKLNFKLLAGEDGVTNQVESLYTCDLLSLVMGSATENQLWFTVMGNVNAIAVATLKDVSAIVLTDNASLDEEAKTRANQVGMAVYVTEKDSATALIETYNLVK